MCKSDADVSVVQKRVLAVGEVVPVRIQRHATVAGKNPGLGICSFAHRYSPFCSKSLILKIGCERFAYVALYKRANCFALYSSELLGKFVFLTVF